MPIKSLIVGTSYVRIEYGKAWVIKMNQEKRKQVYDILMTPIKCEDRKAGISLINGTIFTGQTYYSGLDEDMSDFAVDFYQIIYAPLLKNNLILNSNGRFVNPEFAGDTMNSYKTVKKRCSCKFDCDYLKWYKNQYHCLANFWILPMHIGRTSKITPANLRTWSKTSNEKRVKDYMDRFICLYDENQDTYKGLFIDYFFNFEGINDFAKKHFLIKSYVSEYGQIYKFSNDEFYGESVIASMESKINQRAKAISESDYAERLWDYFNMIGLIAD